MAGNVTAHFEVVVVVHVGLEERDNCSLVEGSPGMVVVVVGILGMLMVEEGMLFINISYIEFIPKYGNLRLVFEDRTIGILADLGGANHPVRSVNEALHNMRTKKQHTRKMLTLRRGRRRK